LASTTDWRWLEEVERTMIHDDEARIDVLNLPDTTGRADWQTIHWMFRQATRHVLDAGRADDVTLSTHNHDDRGRAVNNSTAAIRGVADEVYDRQAWNRLQRRPEAAGGAVMPRIQVEVASGDSLGERAGNTNHAQFALDFLLYIADGRLNPERGKAISVEYIVDTEPSKEVAEYIMAQAGLSVHPRAHAIGDWINKIFSGAHADAVAKARAADIYFAFNAQWFGHDSPAEIGDGKYQGRRGKANIGAVEGYKSEMAVVMEEVAEKVAVLGLKLPDEDALERVVIAINTQAVETGRQIADSEIEVFIAAETGEKIVDSVVVQDIRKIRNSPFSEIVLSRADGSPMAMVTVDLRSDAIEMAGKAINDALGFDGDVADLHVHALSSKLDADAGAIIEVAANGQPVSAYAEGDSVVNASIKAYGAAISLTRRIEERS
jgi:isopropylmalate/homocitrate/citramalate synthase